MTTKEKWYFQFQSKKPYRTWWLHIWGYEPCLPIDLLEDFQRAGWTTQSLPSGPDRWEVDVLKKGTGVFNGWNNVEHNLNMAEARTILKRHGITGVSKKRLTLEDLL